MYPATQLNEALLSKPEIRDFDSPLNHWNFSLTYSFRPHYGIEVDPAPNRTENQEFILGGGVKTAGE